MLSAFCRLAAIGLVSTLAALPLQAQTCEDRVNDYERRITICDAEFVAATDPEVAAVALGYEGEALRLLGRLDEAAAVLQRSLALAPTNGWYWIELGNVRFDQGDAAGAVAHLTTALELKPGDTYARSNRADAWRALDAPDRCLADTTPVLEAEPDNAFASLVHGRCLTAMGRAEEALPHIDRAIAADPAYLVPQLARMTALMALGRHAEAAALADSALAGKHYPAPLLEEQISALRLTALARTETADQVLAEADKLAAAWPGNLTADNVRVWTLLHAGRTAEAETAAAALRAAVGTAAMEGAFHDTLAQLEMARGHTDAALLHYGRALALDASLTRPYTRSLSEMGFLPLSGQIHMVLVALQRCIAAKGAECRIGV